MSSICFTESTVLYLIHFIKYQIFIMYFFNKLIWLAVIFGSVRRLAWTSQWGHIFQQQVSNFNVNEREYLREPAKDKLLKMLVVSYCESHLVLKITLRIYSEQLCTDNKRVVRSIVCCKPKRTGFVVPPPERINPMW